MKRILVAAALLAFTLTCGAAAHAQMGMDMFKRPSFSKIFNPVVGKGAEYESTSSGSGENRVRTFQMFVIGTESVQGKDAYWMEFVVDSAKGKMVGKSLMTKDDYQPSKMIVQMAGQPAYEMPANMMAMNRSKVDEGLNEWHSVGTESIAVPAGTFTCEHWHNDKRNSDVWMSDKVSPFGMVKQTSSDQSMVLTKVLAGEKDQITGPVQKFDMQQMMQQMQQQHQQQQQPQP